MSTSTSSFNSFYLDETFDTILEADLSSTKIVPALFGGPGISKSARIKELARKNNWPFHVLQMNTIQEKGDLTGVRTVERRDENGNYNGQFHQIYIPNEIVTAANEDAKKLQADDTIAEEDKIVLLILEEINRADSDVTSAGMTLSTERKCGNIDLEPNIRLIVTGNLEGNVTELDDASMTRFARYEVIPHYATWVDYMNSTPDGLHPAIRAVLDRNRDLLVCQPQDNTAPAKNNDDDDNAEDLSFLSQLDFGNGSTKQHTNPRTIEGLNHWLIHHDDAQIKKLMATSAPAGDEQSLLQNIIIAHTGDTLFSTELYLELTRTFNQATQNNNSTIQVEKPEVYTDITNASTRNEQENIIRQLDQDTTGKLILYTLVEQRGEAADILDMVLSTTAFASFNSSFIGDLFMLNNNGLITDNALSVVSRSPKQIAQLINSIISTQPQATGPHGVDNTTGYTPQG